MDPFWFEEGAYTCSECGNTFALKVDQFQGYYTLRCPYCGNDAHFELLSQENKS